VNPSTFPTGQRYFCLVRDKWEGPFDLIELAAQLRYATIDPETRIRLEGEEAGLPLRELPEFVSVQEIPIETIAWHLEEKERSLHSSDARTGVRWSLSSATLSSATWLAMYLLGGAILALFLTLIREAWTVPAPKLTFVAAPAVAPKPAPWPTTRAGGFSVQCPFPLKPIITLNPKRALSYRAEIPEVCFGLDLFAGGGNRTDTDYSIAFNGMRDQFLGSLYGAEVLSDRDITVNGCTGRDILISYMKGTKQFEAGMRLLGGRGELGGAWVVLKSDKFSPDDVNRFLNSFELR
jgi:hypothetical protein